jgi:hypothetical protein
MSKGQRRTSTEVAIGKLLVVAHIRPADAGGLDLDLKLACRGLFETSGFLYDRLEIWATRICLRGTRTNLRSRAPCSTLAVTVAGLEERVRDSNETGTSSAVAEGAILYKVAALISLVNKKEYEYIDRAVEVGGICAVRGGHLCQL